MKDNYGIYKYTGPATYLSLSEGGYGMILLIHDDKVKAEVNINVATIKGVYDKYSKEYDKVKEFYVAAKYLKPVKPETIDFAKDDADSEWWYRKKLDNLCSQHGWLRKVQIDRDKTINTIEDNDGNQILRNTTNFFDSVYGTQPCKETYECLLKMIKEKGYKPKNADKESAQHIVDMIMDDKDFEHLIGFQNFCESIMGMRFGNQHNDNHEVGGNHYKMAIEPWDYIFANKLDFDSGNVVKYISRHKKKNGAEDVKKAISFCKHILKTQYGEEV